VDADDMERVETLTSLKLFQQRAYREKDGFVTGKIGEKYMKQHGYGIYRTKGESQHRQR
jgi:hypothetical protein